MLLSSFAELFSLKNKVTDLVDVQRREYSRPTYVEDLKQSGVSEYVNMPVDSAVIQLQIACYRRYV